MIDTPSPDDETTNYSMMDQIDQICDQYEAELRRDSQPLIEDYLKRIEGPARNRLLRDLISLELEFTQRDHAVKFAEYFDRFPESRELLESLNKELELSSPRRPDVPGIELSGGITIASGESIPELKHFELLNVAGTGGFGTVWRATDLRLQRIVAVKIPRSDRAGQIDVYGVTREARVAAKLRHPNIVSVHEVGEESGISFIVTDYIDGMNLKDWKKKNAINPFDAARLVAKLAEAIQYAHVNGVIHRDLKLANVLMDASGEPHVADFGLAKREARDDSLAVHGQVLGTPAYMAPEQARADHDSIDRRTDVYSLGVILYELMTGTTPFHGAMPHILQQIVESPPAAPRSIKSDIPKELEAICLKCLAKDRAKRYETAQSLADDLYLFLSGETLRGIPAALSNRVWKWVRRNRRFVVVVSVVAFLVGSVSAGFVAWRHRVPRPSVEFTSDPPGCEITVVTLDPVTGEPDPTQIRSAIGRTPLTMSLAAGDYLVVAVLNSSRFNEVLRHVPEKNEALSFRPRHLNWKRLPSGVIAMDTIPIPRPDISLKMGFVDTAESFAEPQTKLNVPPRTWRIPAFFVDQSEVSVKDLSESPLAIRFLPGVGDGPFAKLQYDRSVWYLETIGKRLPSAAEMYYLSTAVCLDIPDNAGASDCKLPDQTTIHGLRSDPWEWTSTKPGGPFSGSSPLPLELESLTRVTGGGKPAANYETRAGLQTERGLKQAGFRGVRSEKPRRQEQDFVALAARPKGR